MNVLRIVVEEIEKYFFISNSLSFSKDFVYSFVELSFVVLMLAR